MNPPSWQISASARQVWDGLWIGDFVPTFGLTNPQHAPATPPLLSTQLKGKNGTSPCSRKHCGLGRLSAVPAARCWGTWQSLAACFSLQPLGGCEHPAMRQPLHLLGRSRCGGGPNEPAPGHQAVVEIPRRSLPKLDLTMRLAV